MGVDPLRSVMQRAVVLNFRAKGAEASAPAGSAAQRSAAQRSAAPPPAAPLHCACSSLALWAGALPAGRAVKPAALPVAQTVQSLSPRWPLPLGGSRGAGAPVGAWLQRGLSCAHLARTAGAQGPLVVPPSTLFVGPQITLVQGENFSWFGYPDDTSPSARNFLPGLHSQAPGGAGPGSSNGGSGGSGRGSAPGGAGGSGVVASAAGAAQQEHKVGGPGWGCWRGLLGRAVYVRRGHADWLCGAKPWPVQAASPRHSARAHACLPPSAGGAGCRRALCASLPRRVWQALWRRGGRQQRRQWPGRRQQHLRGQLRQQQRERCGAGPRCRRCGGGGRARAAAGGGAVQERGARPRPLFFGQHGAAAGAVR